MWRVIHSCAGKAVFRSTEAVGRELELSVVDLISQWVIGCAAERNPPAEVGKECVWSTDQGVVSVAVNPDRA